jgi:hypothetical protein
LGATIAGMSKDEPELQLIPEDPELIKWARWVYHHGVAEAAVIRGAKGALTLATLAIAAALYFILGAYHEREDHIKDATIQFQAQQLAEYRNKLQVNNPEEAAKKLAALEKKLKPILGDPDRQQRQLSQDQKQKLIRIFEPIKVQLANYWVWIGSTEDQESINFAGDFTKSFKSAGLRVAYMGMGPADDDDDGIYVTIIDQKNPTALDKLVLDGLSKAGIVYKLQPRENDYPNPPEMEFMVNSNKN